MRIVSLLLMLALFGAVSCSKEKSFEVGTVSRGSLKASNSNECLPKTVAGSFIVGNVLTDSNYLEVDVDVAVAGAYTIKTDTTNGFYFSGSGNFTKTGINHIRLTGKGTPETARTEEFFVYYDTSICTVPVTVLPAGSNSGPAVFTLLRGSGDSCMGATVNGSYAKGVALDGNSTVAIRVNVTTPGTYTVATNTANGFSFSATSAFATTGEQTITLTASGTPAAVETTVFTVTAGSTTCTFSVGVSGSVTPPPAGTGDLFPLSAGSYWTYDVSVPGVFSDTSFRENAGTGSINGATYQVFIQKLMGVYDTSVYRKSGSDYYSVIPVDLYTQIELDTPQFAEMVFLKEGLAAGTTWTSDEYTGTEQGKPVTIKYVYTCTGANTSLVINGKNFNDVCVVNQRVEATIDGEPYVPEGGESGNTSYTFYYARGVGLIQAISELGGTADLEIKIRYWKVN